MLLTGIQLQAFWREKIFFGAKFTFKFSNLLRKFHTIYAFDLRSIKNYQGTESTVNGTKKNIATRHATKTQYGAERFRNVADVAVLIEVREDR